MKALISLLIMLSSNLVYAQYESQGYTRRDGVHVAPYEHTKNNGNLSDNYSTRGNSNPYDGQQTIREPREQRHRVRY